MARAARLIAALFILFPSFVHANEGDKILVLPFRSIGVDDATVVAVRTVLSGELEARGFRLVGSEAAIPPSGAADPCEESDCAILEAERAGAERVVYGTLCRLGGKLTIRVHALRVGSNTPYFRDQLTAPSDADLPDLLGEIAGAVGTGRATARPIGIARLPKHPPRLAFAGGILLPISDSYAEQSRLTTLRLYLHRERDGVFLEMGIPFAGIAWSGGVGSSIERARAIDWTLYDLFIGKRFETGDRPAHIGLGVGLHRLDFTRERHVYVPWKTAVSCGDCGGADGIAVTGEAGVGTELAHSKDADLMISARLRFTLVPADIGDEKANGVLIQLGAIF